MMQLAQLRHSAGVVDAYNGRGGQSALLCACVAVAAGSPLLVGVQEKAKVRIATLDPVEADTPANTKLLVENEKEMEIPATRVLTYSALPYAHVFRKKRALVRQMHGLGMVAADTPASTALLQPIVSEHSMVVPKMVYMI
ncbi:hypothetical protein FJT64_000560 [Amphibalanus amphitrite]|uniref:Uncharacterized protein n=1 Tax=Amphibalanus amphitrite TaxID=1232801 RepID=A0A6A4W3C0_AMPAM|nr:hypothetical protein FJT64_000560 [Amphibalanus amphitrite]